MRLGSEHEVSANHGTAHDDFASIMEESKFSRFKPLLIVVLVVSALTGGLLYAIPKLQNSQMAAELQPQAIKQTASIDDLAQFSECLSEIEQTNPTPEVDDDAFYPKLIAAYDAQLGCYDQYPNNTMSSNRVSVEQARQGAIDSSGAYKDTYLASGGSYTYKSPSSYANPTTGCSYTLSENEYIKCTDTYNSQHNTSVSNRSPVSTQDTTTNTQPQNAIDAAWCSSKEAEADRLYSDYIAKRDAADAVSTKLYKVDDSRPVGFIGTQSQLDAWRAYEKQTLQSQLTSLIALKNEALQKYNTAQSEMASKSCG